jgi:hypothetical protein
VIVEKPIAHTVEDARALTRAAQAAFQCCRPSPAAQSIIGMARQMIDEAGWAG